MPVAVGEFAAFSLGEAQMEVGALVPRLEVGVKADGGKGLEESGREEEKDR
jgi:hypothetical protein